MDSKSAISFIFDCGRGDKSALEQLLRDDCSLATLPWVKNHWSLIIWKLASLVRTRPELLTQYWTWEVAVNQLKYRSVSPVHSFTSILTSNTSQVRTRNQQRPTILHQASTRTRLPLDAPYGPLRLRDPMGRSIRYRYPQGGRGTSPRHRWVGVDGWLVSDSSGDGWDSQECSRAGQDLPGMQVDCHWREGTFQSREGEGR